MARDPLDKSFTQVSDGVHLHVRTWTLIFNISQTAWRIVFKFGVWLGTHSVSLTQVRYGTHLHVRTCIPLSHDGAFAVARSSPIKKPTGVYCHAVWRKLDYHSLLLPIHQTFSFFFFFCSFCWPKLINAKI